MADVGWAVPAAHSPAATAPAAAGAVVADVRKAVAGGARLVDLGPAGQAVVALVKAAEPDVIVCADTAGADLTRDLAVAQTTGAALLVPAAVCEGGPASYEPGDAAARTVLVAAAPAEVPALVRAGRTVLADVDGAQQAETVAVAAICAWMGARIVRTRHVEAVRQALDMVESVRGARPPSHARRGLA